MALPDVLIDVFPTADAAIRAAAERFVAASAEACQANGRFTVALAGGSTPKPLYALLASAAHATRVDWARVHVCWSDERCVPPDDTASNYRMAREALLDHVALTPENVHRIRGEDEPADAAAAYERELRDLLGSDGRFDLILLGMGDDGHTASLFRASPTLREKVRWVLADHVAATPAWRVTLTPVVLNAAAEVVFLVLGAEKAPMLHRVLEGPKQPDAAPAQVVTPRHGRLRWLADAAAAAALESSE